jgi:hypothetical protein
MAKSGAKDKQPVGRPSKYTEALAKEICEAIATNAIGLKKLCALHPNWPDKATIHLWKIKNEEFYDLYARAKQKQADLMAEECLDIADDSSSDTIIDENGNARCDNEFVQRSRLRIDTRKWLASKLLPKVYGTQDNKSINVNLHEARLEHIGND